MKRPGIRRSRVRSPQAALAQLHALRKADEAFDARLLKYAAASAVERAALLPPGGWIGIEEPSIARRLRNWFFGLIRSLAAKHMKAGL